MGTLFHNFVERADYLAYTQRPHLEYFGTTWCPPRPSDNWRSVLCPIGSKRPYILPFGNRSQNKSGNWNGMAIGTFFHPFSPHFFRLQLNFTYMKRFSYLVSVKNITFKPSYDYDIQPCSQSPQPLYRQLQMFQKVEYGREPIFKVVLECQKRCSEPFLIYIYGIQCDFMPKSC